MTEQSEAEKAAEEEAGCCELMPLFVFDELSGNTDRVQAMGPDTGRTSSVTKKGA